MIRSLRPLSPLVVLCALVLAACGDQIAAEKSLGARGAAVQESKGALAAGEAAAGRKIIYSAFMTLHVEDYGEQAPRLRALLTGAGGYVVELREWHRDGRPGRGDWVMRVPASGLDGFLDRVGELGAVQSRALESEDVTARWADLERRIEVARRIEERYVELLKTTRPDLEQTLALEERLIRTRAEIEAQEGSLRQLDEVVRFATVRLSLRSLRSTRSERLALGDEAASAWESSLRGLRSFGRALVIGLVILAPWLVLALPLALGLVYFWRRRRAR